MPGGPGPWSVFSGLVLGWHPDGRGFRAERAHVAGMDLGPEVLRRLRRAIQVAGQELQADVPARGVPGRLAELVERVQQGEGAALTAGGDLQPDHVRAPAELQQRRRLAG